jgi:hypothetical protein
MFNQEDNSQKVWVDKFNRTYLNNFQPIKVNLLNEQDSEDNLYLSAFVISKKDLTIILPYFLSLCQNQSLDLTITYYGESQFQESTIIITGEKKLIINSESEKKPQVEWWINELLRSSVIHASVQMKI